MACAVEVKFSLQVRYNQGKTKILFVEADGDFMDVLFSFLMLPIGKIMQILVNHYADGAPIIGSLTTLFKALSDAKNANLWTDGGSEVLRYSRSTHEDVCRNLKINPHYIPPKQREFEGRYPGVFAAAGSSFVMTDDLQVLPSVVVSSMETLCRLGIDITALEGTESEVVTFGLNEIIEFLKALFVSSTPLFDVILKQMNLSPNSSSPQSLIAMFKGKTTESVAMNDTISLDLMFEKSTGRFLFAYAGADFVDFIFSILILPLAKVVQLLKFEGGLKKLNTFYRSVGDLRSFEFIRSTTVKKCLLDPLLPQDYFARHFLDLYVEEELDSQSSSSTPNKFFVEGPEKFIIEDNLTVKPFDFDSCISALKGMNINLDDMKEERLHIGKKEALSILNACLTSKTALTMASPKPKKWILEAGRVKRRLGGY